MAQGDDQDSERVARLNRTSDISYRTRKEQEKDSVAKYSSEESDPKYALNAYQSKVADDARNTAAKAGGYGSYKKGGMVKKTGLAKLHSGERVLNRKQTKRYNKAKGGKR